MVLCIENGKIREISFLEVCSKKINFLIYYRKFMNIRLYEEKNEIYFMYLNY